MSSTNHYRVYVMLMFYAMTLYMYRRLIIITEVCKIIKLKITTNYAPIKVSHVCPPCHLHNSDRNPVYYTRALTTVTAIISDIILTLKIVEI